MPAKNITLMHVECGTLPSKIPTFYRVLFEMILCSNSVAVAKSFWCLPYSTFSSGPVRGRYYWVGFPPAHATVLHVFCQNMCLVWRDNQCGFVFSFPREQKRNASVLCEIRSKKEWQKFFFKSTFRWFLEMCIQYKNVCHKIRWGVKPTVGADTQK